MPEPLTIYECPLCGRRELDRIYVGHGSAKDGEPCPIEPRPVRVFREENVRPLWEAVMDRPKTSVPFAIRSAGEAFPAPPDWTADEPDEDEDREPTDHELYNRPGMEGGIPYRDDPPMHRHDERL